MTSPALGVLIGCETSGVVRRAFYNEIDPAACSVLRQVMADGVIAPGAINTRSIKDLKADDIADFTQAHFFAGGGLWSVAARLAGWPDDLPLWTGSCPCQPFSVAGKRAGRDDPRHLWPDFFRLIEACRPAVVVGEQVAGKAGRDWFDGVAADLEGAGYACRAVDIPACAVDAPHIRQRLYWVAVADSASARWLHAALSGIRRQAQGARSRDGEPERRDGDHGHRRDDAGPTADADGRGRDGRSTAASSNAPGNLGDALSARLERLDGDDDGASGRPISGRPIAEADYRDDMADRSGDGWEQGQLAAKTARHGRIPSAAHGANGSFWTDAEWIICHDGKARRTKPGIRLLVDGSPGRVGLWRIAGNAISPILAAEVLKALLDTMTEEGWPS